MCKHKVRLTGSVSILDSIEFDLKVLEPDGKVSIFVIEVTIAIDQLGLTCRTKYNPANVWPLRF